MVTQQLFGQRLFGLSQANQNGLGRLASAVTGLIPVATALGVLWLWLGALQVTATPALASSSSLIVNIDGLKSQEGNVCLALFSNSQDFPMRGEKALRNECFKVSGLTMQVMLKGLPPGTYAIAALHDANGDHQANRNRLGLPTEGFGFSQNPGFSFSPPSFEEACFRLSSKAVQVPVQIHYLGKG
jgi:uncharacterized protein (DUF2141 family)